MARSAPPSAPLIFAALGLLAGCKGKSDQDLINEIIDQTIAAANERKAGGVVEHAAEDFVGPQGANLQECRRILIGYFLRNGWVHVFERDRTIEVQGSSATVKLGVVIAVGNAVQKLEDLIPTNGTQLLFDVQLEKIGGEWKYLAASYTHVR